MHHPNGRHRRPVESLAARLWRLPAAAALATALTYVFTPQTPGPEPRAITPAPERPALAPAPSVEPVEPDAPEPDEIGGALVRPYMLTRIPRPRLPEGDLLAGPAPGEFDELASLIRHYLDRSG
ncbi:hypothetical protein [Nocardiopsis lucentensis]|uniref:hypothetical protein n=1 Tax=Nocardiopsis lucentensis TaxID=53441 RepID=UPI0003479ABD|nr:hypothetical protein [Nocardiopsis lucentensis]